MRETRTLEELGDELKALDAMDDSDIDFSDIPEILDFSNFVVGKFYRPMKQHVSIRLDADIIQWFMAGDKKGYQSRINEALREYVTAKTANKKSSRRKMAHKPAAAKPTIKKSKAATRRARPKAPKSPGTKKR